jgi:hypothetical protein
MQQRHDAKSANVQKQQQALHGRFLTTQLLEAASRNSRPENLTPTFMLGFLTQSPGTWQLPASLSP